MQQRKNSAAATAELNKTNFAYKNTRLIAATQGLNSRLRTFAARIFQDSQHSLTSPLNFPKALSFLLFLGNVFDKNTAGKLVYQAKRAGDLGLVSPANATVVLLFFPQRCRSETFDKKRQKLLFLLFLAVFLVTEVQQNAKSPKK